MAPSIKIPLPAGALQVAFIGIEPKVSGVSPGSPLFGQVKIGYRFIELILGDGSIMEGLDTNELVSALNEYSDDVNRSLKLEMSLPAESTVVLQSGVHGLVIENKFGKALLTRIDYGSPLRKEIRVGMVVDCLEMSDGYKITGHSAEEINDALASSSNDTKRTLVLKSPEVDLSPRDTILPKYKIVTLPAGTTDELGMKLSGEIAKVSVLKNTSSLAGNVRSGYVIESLKHADGHEFRGISGREMTACIDSTGMTEGRVVTLKNPKLNKLPSVASVKIMIPSEGDWEEFGISVNYDPATVTAIHPDSLYYGMINRGFKVAYTGWADGTEFESLSAIELEEIMKDSTGLEGRYMVFENKATVAPSYVDVNLQPGKLGAVFKGTPPVLTRLNEGSQLSGLVEIGMAVDMLKLANGAIFYEMDAVEFTNALKSSSNSVREVRFINLDEVPMTQKPVIQATDEMNIVLPMGKLGVMFKGSDRAIISRVKSGSPLSGIVPEGMAVDIVTIEDRDYMELNANDLAELLSSTSEIPGRTMKLRDAANTEEFSRLPDDIDVLLPTGKLGCTFSGTPPVAKSFKESSPIAGAIPPGMFVDKLIMPDGYSVSGLSTKELVKVLGQFSEEEGRIIVLKNMKSETPSPKEETFPEEKTVVFPTGKIGISFKGSKYARISRLHEGSPLVGKVYEGMILDSINIPGGSEFSGMTAKECARVLVDTKMVGGRTAMFKSPGSKYLSVRNIASDDKSIGGSSQDMSEDFSRRVG
eukprot:CAMPEP_0194145386 /NCGR_PEP_ID=MMETSP0152-20130528/17290_1 /TAXON_ID=1049557 /ORGANISM="Thalassiothrix antarctica, Strain L6-D1" /LENGTH=756 /DNA_ID=CAMNT_0038845615 /DNA_START=62 /DNA_END=2332 /DNA_ORIENTATION=+